MARKVEEYGTFKDVVMTDDDVRDVRVGDVLSCNLSYVVLGVDDTSIRCRVASGPRAASQSTIAKNLVKEEFTSLAALSRAKPTMVTQTKMQELLASIQAEPFEVHFLKKPTESSGMPHLAALLAAKPDASSWTERDKKRLIKDIQMGSLRRMVCLPKGNVKHDGRMDVLEVVGDDGKAILSVDQRYDEDTAKSFRVQQRCIDVRTVHRLVINGCIYLVKASRCATKKAQAEMARKV